MKPLVLVAGTSLLLLPLACGGTVVFEEDGGEGQGGGDGGSNGTASVTSGQSVAGTTSGPTATAATAGGSGPTATVSVTVGQGGAGGAPGTDIQPTIVEVSLYANCKPEVGPDPIGGTVTVAYRNGGGQAGSLEGLTGNAIFASEVEGWSFSLELSPSSSGVVGAGETIEVQHLKIATEGDSSFVCQLCSMTGTLALSWADVSGQEVPAYADFQLACAL